jgi:hypothetical protein
MVQRGSSYNIKYKALQKTEYWKEAKLLIKEFRLLNGSLTCDICKIPIVDHWTLHHETYNNDNLFTPLFVQTVHNECHPKTVKKKSKTGVRKCY